MSHKELEDLAANLAEASPSRPGWDQELIAKAITKINYAARQAVDTVNAIWYQVEDIYDDRQTPLVPIRIVQAVEANYAIVGQVRIHALTRDRFNPRRDTAAVSLGVIENPDLKALADPAQQAGLKVNWVTIESTGNVSIGELLKDSNSADSDTASKAQAMLASMSENIEAIVAAASI